MDWVVEALRSAGGSASIVYVARHIWEHHSDELESSQNDLFYTWQYDMRWAAKTLRDRGALAPADECRRGEWALTSCCYV